MMSLLEWCCMVFGWTPGIVLFLFREPLFGWFQKANHRETQRLVFWGERSLKKRRTEKVSIQNLRHTQGFQTKFLFEPVVRPQSRCQWSVEIHGAPCFLVWCTCTHSDQLLLRALEGHKTVGTLWVVFEACPLRGWRKHLRQRDRARGHAQTNGAL